MASFSIYLGEKRMGVGSGDTINATPPETFFIIRDKEFSYLSSISYSHIFISLIIIESLQKYDVINDRFC